MPDETRNYLPKLQAMKNIVSDPARYNLELADIPDAPYFAVVKTTRQMDMKRAAELAEMSVEEFQYLNPHHNRPVIAGADEYAILLPIDKAEVFAAKLDLTDQPLVSWQAYRAAPRRDAAAGRGASSACRSRRCARSTASARRRACRSGTRCWCRRSGLRRESEASLTSAVFTTVPQGRTFYYRVNRGDTLDGHRGALRGDDGGPAPLEQPRPPEPRRRPAAAHHQRPRAERGAGEARERRPGQGRAGEGRAGEEGRTAAKPAAKSKAGTSSGKPPAKAAAKPSR